MTIPTSKILKASKSIMAVADLKHNSDLSRLDLSIDKIPPKYELYKQAIRILESD